MSDRLDTLFSWAAEFVERADGGVPAATAPVSRLAVSDADVFPGRPRVDVGSVTSGGFSGESADTHEHLAFTHGFNSSYLPSATSRSFAIDVLDGCIVNGGSGAVWGHSPTFRWPFYANA